MSLPQTETKNATAGDFAGPFAQIITQLGKARLSADRLVSLGNSGLIGDLAKCPDPRKVDRDTLRRVLAGEKRVLTGALEIGDVKIEPPPGGRIHLIGDLPVDENRNFLEAVNSAGPDTDKNSDIHRVGAGLWTPEAGESSEQLVSETTLLVNFGPGYPKIDSEVAKWVRAYSILRPITPRRCLAIGEYRPLLHCEVGMDPIGVASMDRRLIAGSARVVCMWWHGSRREAFFGFRSDGWGDCFWFGFACGSPSLAL